MKKIRPEIFSSYRFGELVDEYVQGDVNKPLVLLAGAGTVQNVSLRVEKA